MSDLAIFDREILKLKRQRFQDYFADYDFLRSYAAKLMIERLQDITRSFENCVYIGSPVQNDVLEKIKNEGQITDLLSMDTLFPKHRLPLSIIGDEEFFPFGHGKLDLIITNLNLHQTNDLPGVLIQIKRALKPDGMFMAAMFGGETLWQLRQSLQFSEQTLTGGISPRVHPFADKQQMGALLQRAGFALPVVDSEIITVTYSDIFKLMKDLRGMGETNIVKNRIRANTKKDLFLTAGQFYKDHFSDDQGKIEATFEIIFLIGWSPSETQQKPLRPGSAEKSLAEALGTKEIGAGEHP